MERFTIERIVGDIALEIVFRTVVGTVSRSQYESDDWESKLSISSKVVGEKEWSRGGGEGGRERAGVEEGLVCRLKCSFRFYQRSVWEIALVGQSEGMMWVGSDLQFCNGGESNRKSPVTRQRRVRCIFPPVWTHQVSPFDKGVFRNSPISSFCASWSIDEPSSIFAFQVLARSRQFSWGIFLD